MLCLVFALIASVAADQCQTVCNLNYDPVCGSDGRTYGNACELLSTECQQRSGVTKLYNGECQPQKVNKLTGCQMMCTRNYAPVCGSDGQTYGNECELTTKACLTRSHLSIMYDGECQVVPTSECQLMCTRDYSPVCGTDGITYGNRCELSSQACLKKSGVTEAYSGECEKMCQVVCKLNYNPVCGTDNVTYSNLCALESSACLRKNHVTVAKYGEC